MRFLLGLAWGRRAAAGRVQTVQKVGEMTGVAVFTLCGDIVRLGRAHIPPMRVLDGHLSRLGCHCRHTFNPASWLKEGNTTASRRIFPKRLIVWFNDELCDLNAAM